MQSFLEVYFGLFYSNGNAVVRRINLNSKEMNNLKGNISIHEEMDESNVFEIISPFITTKLFI